MPNMGIFEMMAMLALTLVPLLSVLIVIAGVYILYRISLSVKAIYRVLQDQEVRELQERNSTLPR